MDVVVLKAELLKLLHFAATGTETFLAKIGEDEAEQHFVDSDNLCSVRDHVVHVAIGMQKASYMLQMLRGYGTITEDIANVKHSFTTHRTYTWAALKEQSQSLFTTFMPLVNEISPEQLILPVQYVWSDQMLVWEKIVSRAVWHPYTHWAEIGMQVGNVTDIANWYGTVLEKGREKNLPVLYGSAVYNLACLSARTEQTAKALALLPEAFLLDPGLIELAQKDSDLDAIRSESAFKDIVSSCYS